MGGHEEGGRSRWHPEIAWATSPHPTPPHLTSSVSVSNLMDLQTLCLMALYSWSLLYCTAQQSTGCALQLLVFKQPNQTVHPRWNSEGLLMGSPLLCHCACSLDSFPIALQTNLFQCSFKRAEWPSIEPEPLLNSLQPTITETELE